MAEPYPGDTTNFAGIEIPSTDPVFLAIVAVHIVLGITAVATGALAMLSPKAPGRHPGFGLVYFWSLAALVVTASALSFMRWQANAHLFMLGMLALTAAIGGRIARRLDWPRWAWLHVTFMGSSYIVMITAFYVDNGRQLPLWQDLPHWTYWVVPALVGVPIMVWTLVRHPLTRTLGNRDKPVAD